MFEPRAVDGDTVTAWVQLSSEVRQLWRIRLKGIEGGELNTDEGLAAHTILAGILNQHRDQGMNFVGLETVKDQHGRHVGDVLLPTGKMLTSTLAETGRYWARARNKAPGI